MHDLFGTDVDAAALLPTDGISDGFDNIASALKVSPQVDCPAGAMEVVVILPVTPLTVTAIDTLHPVTPAGTTKLIWSSAGKAPRPP